MLNRLRKDSTALGRVIFVAVIATMVILVLSAVVAALRGDVIRLAVYLMLITAVVSRARWVPIGMVAVYSGLAASLIMTGYWVAATLYVGIAAVWLWSWKTRATA